MATVSTLTNYNSIYKKTYWGNFTTLGNERITVPAIIQARNDFILNYKIVKNKKCLQKYGRMRSDLHLDHTEFYEDDEGRYIYVYSMHHSYPLVEGFTKINSMYAPDQTTAIKIFETTKSLKLKIK